MALSKRMRDRIEEINQMSSQVDQFYCDFGSTVEDCIWDLKVTYNDRFVWIKSSGISGYSARYTLTQESAIEDLSWDLSQLRKGLKQSIKYQ